MEQAEWVQVRLHDGRTEKGRLASPFRPMEQKVILATGKGETETIPLHHAMYVLFRDEIKQAPAPHLPGEVDEVVNTKDDKSFHVRVLSQQDFSIGFFGVLTGEESDYQRVFFPWHGVRNRQELRHIGEILRDEGVLSEPALEKTLKEQEYLRSQRVGDILSKQHGVPQQDINRIERERRKVTSGSMQLIGEILISANLITREQLKSALDEQRKTHNQPLGDLLIRKGMITEEQLLMALALKFRLHYIDLSNVVPSEEALQMLPVDAAERFKVFPIRLDEQTLVVATSEPTNADISDMLRFRTNHRIELVVASSSQIREMTQKYYRAERHATADLSQMVIDFSAVGDEDEEQNSDIELQIEAEKAPIVKLANQILLSGIQEAASDIHVLPVSQGLKISFRIDGQLRQHLMLDKRVHKTLITRFKIISGMDITEHRLPQDGRVLMTAFGRHIELRVSCMPGQYGENIIFRILSRDGRMLDLDTLGFEDGDRENIRHITHGAHGILLVTGPTGSGKSTTLLAILKEMTSLPKHLISLEDPIEAKLDGVNQIQINPKIGFSFASALRNVLRHDPDVIMVGEIRDQETAQIAVQAALTGHTLLSSLHTNHAVGAVSRLVNMEVDRYLIAATVKGVLAQQLIPKLCEHCRQEAAVDEITRGILSNHGIEWGEDSAFVAPGCEQCHGTGIAGRLLVYELLLVSEEIQRLIGQNASEEALMQAAREQGMVSMAERGVAMARRGETALEYILPLLVD
ncbi:MAG TPA: GspE/PulE family protein [Mariprofundaceae bacterium]|nr:GspE/PulE family protein [Mariprofundaceae bacterium]